MIPAKIFSALLLLGATIVAWQFRFEHAGPPLLTPFKPGMPGWTWHGAKNASHEPNENGIITVSRLKGEPDVSVEHSAGELGDARFLHVEMDASWHDVRENGGIRWANARVVIFGRQPDGSITWPHDHGIVSAVGTRGWQHEEGVFDLAPGLGEIYLAIQHLGESGTLRVGKVEMSVVRQRSWFKAVGTVLTILWIGWAAWVLAPVVPRWRILRAGLTGIVAVAATWVLVFPQPRFLVRPLVGSFQLGASPDPAPSPAPPELPASAPEGPLTVAETPVSPPASAAPTPIPKGETNENVTQLPPDIPVRTIQNEPQPEKREARPLDTLIRTLRDQLRVLHLAAFGGFGLLLFAFAGTRTWPFAAWVAIASEALPNYQLHQPWDRGDLVDLMMDATGLILAALVIGAIGRLRKRRSVTPMEAVSR